MSERLIRTWPVLPKSSLEKDMINHPPHYNYGKHEVIDVIEGWGLDYHLGNAVKYIARSRHKGSEVADLEKAIWYIRRKLDKLKTNAP